MKTFVTYSHVKPTRHQCVYGTKETFLEDFLDITKTLDTYFVDHGCMNIFRTITHIVKQCTNIRTHS